MPGKRRLGAGTEIGHNQAADRPARAALTPSPETRHSRRGRAAEPWRRRPLRSSARDRMAVEESPSASWWPRIRTGFAGLKPANASPNSFRRAATQASVGRVHSMLASDMADPSPAALAVPTAHPLQEDPGPRVSGRLSCAGRDAEFYRHGDAPTCQPFQAPARPAASRAGTASPGWVFVALVVLDLFGSLGHRRRDAAPSEPPLRTCALDPAHAL